MINVQSEYMEDQPSRDGVDGEDDVDPNDPPLEPKKYITKNFIDDDNEEDFRGKTGNIIRTDRRREGSGGNGQTNTYSPRPPIPPRLPGGLQKIKDIYDFFETQKAMVTVFLVDLGNCSEGEEETQGRRQATRETGGQPRAHH